MSDYEFLMEMSDCEFLKDRVYLAFCIDKLLGKQCLEYARMLHRKHLDNKDLIISLFNEWGERQNMIKSFRKKLVLMGNSSCYDKWIEIGLNMIFDSGNLIAVFKKESPDMISDLPAVKDKPDEVPLDKEKYPF